jgi:hypothetical protein
MSKFDVVIDSRVRDSTSTSSSNLKYTLSKPLVNVDQVQLVFFSIPYTMYVIHLLIFSNNVNHRYNITSSNNIISFFSNGSIKTATLTAGLYTGMFNIISNNVLLIDNDSNNPWN